MEDFEREIKVGFLEEAAQLLSEAEQCFLKLEGNPSDPGIIDQIFRLAHNLKGSSKAVGFEAMGAFTHVFESLLLKIKNGQKAATPPIVSLLLRCNDRLNQMIEAYKGNLDAVVDCTDLTQELQTALDTNEDTSVTSKEAQRPEEVMPELSSSSPPLSTEQEPLGAAQGELVAEGQEIQDHQDHQDPTMSDLAVIERAEARRNVSEPLPAEASDLERSTPSEALSKTDSKQVAGSAETQTCTKSTEGNAASTPRPSAPATPTAANPAVDESIRVSLTRLEKLINYVGELVIMQTVLQEQAAQVPSLRKSIQQLGKVTKEVQEISMSLRMVPLKQTFQKMQRIVRDTSGLLNKKVHLHIAGDETELDKTVLERVSDPLVHIVRNAVDHGIESATDRINRGKSEEGNVWLSAYHQGGKLVIEVRDDGGGINGEYLAKKAREKGLLKEGQKLTENESVQLIFHPGFSTKEQVTEVSGRGVGMDVVKTNIQQLQGEIQIQTKIGEGTTFKILLPLTLAIIDGMVVKSHTERYVIPLAHVNESLKPDPKDIQFNTGIGECLLLRGENLPLYRLSHLLGRKTIKKDAAPQENIAIVFRESNRAYSLLVDDIIGQQQIVIKKLGKEIQNLKGFSGSAILGDGRPSLILEMGDLIDSKGRLVA